MAPNPHNPLGHGRSLVTFRGGFAADWQVVERLLDLERRGVRFELVEDGRFRVSPPEVLTDADRHFLRAHRDEARRCLEYTVKLCEAPL